MNVEPGPGIREPRELPFRPAAAGKGAETPFGALLARMLVKAMRSTLREDGPLSGGAGSRLFGQVLEEALSEAVASKLGTAGRLPPWNPEPRTNL